MSLKTIVHIDGLAKPGAPFSAAIVAQPGRLLFISGLLARGPDGAIVGKGDVSAQTRCICENLERVVEAAGGTLDCLVRLDVYVADISKREEIYAVRREFFKADTPVSTMVQVGPFTDRAALIEINAIGVLP